MYLWLLLYGLVLVESDSCCGSTGCSQSCPWNGACGDGTNHECMDGIAGPFKCRDDTKCHNYDDCTDHDAALRAGHICNGFPFYAGGYPMNPIVADAEKETYGCLSSSGEYCGTWWTLEDSLDQFEIGEGVCDTPSSNGKYCLSWTVEQEEYQKCWLESYYDEEEGRYLMRELCCESHPNEPCCRHLCDASFYNAHHSEHETTECDCRVESASGEYCLEWYCEEYGNYNPGQTWYQGREKEYYICVNNEPTDKYCNDWYGDIDGYEEFEVSKCRCDTGHGSGAYCDLWSCDELGFDYHWPNLLWSLFSGIMSCPMTIASVLMIPRLSKELKRSAYDERFMIFSLCNLIWVGGFIVIGVWKAGFMVFVFTFPIHLLPLVVYLVCRKNADSPKSVSPKRNPEIVEVELPRSAPPSYPEYIEHNGSIIVPQVVQSLTYESQVQVPHAPMQYAPLPQQPNYMHANYNPQTPMQYVPQPQYANPGYAPQPQQQYYMPVSQSGNPGYGQPPPYYSQGYGQLNMNDVPMPSATVPTAQVIPANHGAQEHLNRLQYLRDTGQISQQAYEMEAKECLKRL